MRASVKVMMTVEQKVLISKAARIDGVEVSEWVRRVVFKAAQERMGGARRARMPKRQSGDDGLPDEHSKLK
jgi:uncharacterized protein (DUF1778 family)